MVHGNYFLESLHSSRVLGKEKSMEDWDLFLVEAECSVLKMNGNGLIEKMDYFS